MNISFVIDVQGVNPDQYYPCDSYVSHINQALTKAGIDTDYREGVDAATSMDYREVFQQSGFKRRELASVMAQGILPARDFFKLCDDMGVLFDDCETMGTLGGPLGGLVPDMAFTHESSLLVLSLRATPIVSTARAWGFVRKLCQSNDFWSLARGDLRRVLESVAERNARKAAWHANRTKA